MSMTQTTKYVTTGFGVAWASFVTDEFIVDLMVAALGGFVAMAAGKTIGGKVWEGIIGFAMGVATAILMRSGGEFNDILTRLGVLVAAILGTKIVEFIRSPAGLNAVGSWLKRVLTTAVGK